MIRRTIEITCDHPTGCTEQYGPKSDELGAARKEAAAAGWLITRNEKTYCRDHAVALGLRR